MRAVAGTCSRVAVRRLEHDAAHGHGGKPAIGRWLQQPHRGERT
jgi:hypothetical protein